MKKVIYITFILLLFFLMYWLNKDAIIQYEWQPTYDTNDKEPFGAYAFDKILNDSWKDKYIHNYFSFSDILSKTASYYDKDRGNVVFPDYNLLIIANRIFLDSIETKFLLKYVENGSSIILASDNIFGPLKDTLNFYLSTPTYPNILDFYNRKDNEKEKVVIFTSDSIQHQIFLPKLLVNNNFYMYPEEYVRVFREEEVHKSIESQKKAKFLYFDSIYRISSKSEEKTLSMRYKIGKGNLILISNPLIFTNYGILNDSINPYIWKHLSYLEGKPLMRTEFYEKGSQGGKSYSEFRVILSNRAFRWAFYTTLIGILILMIFTAKRKQKIIPVIKPPVNKMLDFVRSIAGMYLLKNNNADIVLKKRIYWGEEFKQKYGIDIVNEPHNVDFYKRVAAKTQYPYQEIRRLFLELDAIDETTLIGDDYMMLLIARMNEL